MEKERALAILRNSAVDATGILAKVENEDEAKTIQGYISALDIAIDLLLEDLSRHNGTLSEYEEMLLSAVRYALGRRTYIVKTTVDYIMGELPKLSRGCRFVMERDIESMGFYGDDCDKRDWEKLLKALKKSLED